MKMKTKMKMKNEENKKEEEEGGGGETNGITEENLELRYQVTYEGTRITEENLEAIKAL